MHSKVSKLLQDKKSPTIVVNETGNIIDVNPAFQTTFGWTKDDLLGKPLITIIPAKFRTAHNIGFSRFLATENPTILEQPLQLAILKANGEIVNAIHYIVAEKNNDQWQFASTVELKEN